MNSFVKLFKDYSDASRQCLEDVQWWLKTMVVLNFVFPLLLIFYPEARVTLLCSLIAVAIGLLIFKFDGYTRLLSLMHLPWIWLIWYLVERMDGYPQFHVVWLWMVLLIGVNSISLVLDLKDFMAYLAGNKYYPQTAFRRRS